MASKKKLNMKGLKGTMYIKYLDNKIPVKIDLRKVQAVYVARECVNKRSRK